MRIRDGEMHFVGASLESYRQGPMQRMARRFGVIVPPLTEIAEGEPVPAIINHGRWVVECPDCGGAEFVWREGPHVMMCQSCWNSAVGHKWRRVVMPEDVHTIEELLEARPLPGNRNWMPAESAVDLAQENQEHGLEVTDGLV